MPNSYRAHGKPIGLTPEELRIIYSQMLAARAVDERIWLLNRQGKVAIVVPGQGHEAAQLGAVWAMDRERDLFFTYYRDIAAMVGLGVTVRELILSYMAREGDPFSGARQFPLHGAYPRLRIYNSSSVVASNVPHAVGAALAAKMRREPTVVLSTFGEGATSEGEWHESMNFAGVHRLPVVFLCQNNRYASTQPISTQMAVENLASRASNYGFGGVTVDGCDVPAVYQAVREAAERARQGGGPTLVVAEVERLMPHTTDDDDRTYRSAEELELARARDPVPRFRARLVAWELLTEDVDKSYQESVRAEIEQATNEAEETPYPDPSTLMAHLYGPSGDGAGHGA